ncbi:spore germination lipase LipC [Polycladomyces abyssicola]|uniref:Spore germination lipase LipC n=1 Tax=Polycladomyces abyssicola TaxID=1125966 RepID=A0A8D5UE61_9BACL|nr:GDSL-type esterase/lipase family protein [Polycladomyces abyssicola]BCU81500.1 spore germination lipase LipC [Polycladomyces abyssicola]
MAQHFVYTALGDSITAGYNAPRRIGYAHRLTKRLKHIGLPAKLYTISKKGWTSGDLLQASTWLSTRMAIQNARLITVYIGGNDLILAHVKYLLTRNPNVFNQVISTYGNNLHLLYKQIRRLSPVSVYALNLYNPFPHSALPNTWVPVLNQVTADVSTLWNITVVNIYDLFQGMEPLFIDGYQTGRLENYVPLITRNPVHPNERGHELIAQELWETISFL